MNTIQYNTIRKIFLIMAVPLLFSFGVLGQVEVRIEDANGVEITGTLSLCKGQTKIVYAKKYVNDYLDPNAYNTGWFLDDIYVGSGGTSAPSYTITEQSNNKVLTFLMGPFVNGTGGTLSKKLSIHYYASPNDLYISGLTNVNVNSQQTYNILVGNGRQIHQNYFNATTFNATNNTVLIYPGYFYAYPFDIYANFKKTGITTLSATISQKSTAPCQTAIYTTQVTKTLDINVVDLVPPSTPSDLQVSNVNASSFTLSWSPSFDNYQVAGYKLYNGATLVATLPVSQTSYTFTTQAQYQLKVYAYDPSGNNSATAELGYLYDVLPPTAPTNVIATEVTGTRIALAWNDAIDNVRVAGYDIYINGNLVAANYLRTMYVANITQTPNTITIKAKDGNNNVSPFSLPLVVKKVDPFVIDTAIGNVGIGVNPPTQKLDVDGNVKVRGGKIIMQNPNTDSTNKIVYNAKGLAFSNLATRFSPLHLDNAVNVNGNLNLFGTGNAAGLYAVPTLFMNYNGKITSGGRMVLQEQIGRASCRERVCSTV